MLVAAYGYQGLFYRIVDNMGLATYDFNLDFASGCLNDLQFRPKLFHL